VKCRVRGNVKFCPHFYYSGSLHCCSKTVLFTQHVFVQIENFTYYYNVQMTIYEYRKRNVASLLCSYSVKALKRETVQLVSESGQASRSTNTNGTVHVAIINHSTWTRKQLTQPFKVQWHQIVPFRSVQCHPGVIYIFKFWHSGTLALRAERQSARIPEFEYVR